MPRPGPPRIPVTTKLEAELIDALQELADDQADGSKSGMLRLLVLRAIANSAPTICPCCQRPVVVRKDGRMREHYAWIARDAQGPRCPGAGWTPEEARRLQKPQPPKDHP